MTPYHEGFELTAQEHRPLSDYGTKTLRLRVAQGLQVGIGLASQVMLVQEIRDKSHGPHGHEEASHASEGQLGPKMVAKLFDAKYLDPYDHPPSYANRQYVRETSAYRYLIRHGLGKHIPKFYGSWSTMIADTQGRQRSVQLVLAEYIEGMDMAHLRPADFSTEERKDLIRQVLEAETCFYALDLSHGDLFPRNVIVTETRRVVIIDFGLASIGRSACDIYDFEDTDDLLDGRYISPIVRWWRTDHANDEWALSGWITWSWNQWLADTWTTDIPDITPAMLKWLPYSERQKPFFYFLFHGCDRTAPNWYVAYKDQTPF
ncbi:uncharacterized protein BO95DRAFT_436566 [Aspergillus brunneoviolaceus CBS 621.78]|uniref:Uncharacterized protein n=1 Tax=Aspergillus brunneoviolaceus CBS 621.78 TaxID=1450534 RepID=A0ACD1FUB0_9EURO|nr:hypothetical protein BO95DRAFT_436566 [Aspergillus brunneoviolaceus CBS 621.78]RAH40586.1 hypothetical protein BO95DRAFT_436566 [Aspergillus brunneoviolaceus CBS 621.78]